MTDPASGTAPHPDSARIQLDETSSALAVSRRTLGSDSGPCARCGTVMRAGQRVADLADGTTSHMTCLPTLA